MSDPGGSFGFADDAPPTSWRPTVVLAAHVRERTPLHLQRPFTARYVTALHIRIIVLACTVVVLIDAPSLATVIVLAVVAIMLLPTSASHLG